MTRLRFRAIKKRERNKVIVELVERLLAYGRVINGVALADGLVKGAIKESKIAEELFNFGRDFNIASLKLTADFVSELYPDDPCAGDGKPCENLEVIGEGAKKLDEVGQKLKPNYGAILVDWSVLDSFLRLKIVYDAVKLRRGNAHALIEKLKNRSGTTEDKATLIGGITFLISELQQFKKICEDKLKDVNFESLTEKKYLEEVEKILGFEAAGSFLKKESVEPLKEKLTSILNLAKELKPKLSKENLSKMRRNLKQLFRVVNSPRLPAEEKSLTSAFYSGHSDFARLSKDVEDLFEYNIGLNGSSKQKLKQLFSSLETLNKNMEPVASALRNKQSMVGVEENVMKDFEDAEKEVDMIEETQPLLDCVENMSGSNVEQDITEWKKEKVNSAKIGSSAKDFAEKIRKQSFELSNSTSFVNSIKNNDISVAYDNLQKSTNVDNVIKELEELKNNLENFEGMPISDWAVSTRIPNLIENSKKWLTDQKFLSGLSCAQNKTVIEPVLKNFAKRVQLSAVSMLNAKNQHDAKLKVAVNTVRSVTKEYESFLNKIKTRKVRSAERTPTLEEGLKICQNLSAALKIYRDLIYAYASNKDIQELLKIDTQIESKIAQMTDPDQKKEVKNLWSEETKKTLASIPGIIDKLGQKITTIPKTLTEFGDILKSPVNLEVLKPVDLLNLIDEVQSMDANLIDQGVADRLRTVQMDFANGKLKMEHGLAAFLLSIPWFNSLTNPSQATSASGSSAKHESTPIMSCILIGFGVVFGALLFWYLECVIEVWWVESSKEKSKDKTKKKSKVKSEEKTEENSKEKSKVKSEEKPKETSGEKKVNKWIGYLTKGGRKFGNRITCGACWKIEKSSKDSDVPLSTDKTTPKNDDVSGGKNPKNDDAADGTKVPEVEEPKLEITEKLVKTKVFLSKKGEYYVVPYSNAAPFKNDLCLVEEGKVDPTQDTEVEVEKCEENIKEKLKSSVAKADAFAKDQNLLRAGFRREPEVRRYVQFKSRSRRKYAQMCDWTYTEDVADVEFKLDVEQPKEIYYVGEKFDIFEKEMTGDEVVLKVNTNEEADERTQKTQRSYREEDAKLLKDNSFKSVSTRVINSRSTTSIQKTQDDPGDAERNNEENNQGESRAPAGSERNRADKDNEKEIQYDFDAYCVKKVDKSFSPTIDQVLDQRDSRDQAKYEGKEGECYIKKYRPDVLSYGLINEIALQRLAMSKEVVHYASTLKARHEKHMKLPLVPFQYMLDLVNKVREIFKREPDLLELKRALIRTIGDLHGNHDDMARHMEIGIDDKNSTFLFLGDYVDRGDYSLHVVLHLCLLKLSNEKRYYFLRGNHEFAAINVASFLIECVETYGHDDGTKLWRAINAMFEEMPVAAITQGTIWNAHGGISALMLKGRTWLKANLKKRPQTIMQWQLLIDIMWNDPIERFHLKMTLDEMFPISSRTKYAHLFTQTALDAVLDKCGFDAMFRGHQVKLEGFEQFCNLRCFTVFGACNNTMNNFAAQALVYRAGKVGFAVFRGHDNPNPEKEDDTVCDMSTKKTSSKKTLKPTKESNEGIFKFKLPCTSVSKTPRPPPKPVTRVASQPVTMAKTQNSKRTSNTPAKKK